MLYHVTIDGVTCRVRVEDGVATACDDQSIHARLGNGVGEAVRTLQVEDASVPVLARARGAERWALQLRGIPVDAHVVDERTRVIRSMAGAGAATATAAAVRAPMPGLVIAVHVEPGQAVTRGQGLAIVEAMKMENELTAEQDGHVAAVSVTAGETVEKGQVIVELELVPSEPGAGHGE